MKKYYMDLELTDKLVENFGPQLKRIREEKNIPFHIVCNEIILIPAQLEGIEAGSIMPSFKKIFLLLKFYGIIKEGT